MDEATAKSGAADEASGLCPFHGDQSRASAPDASAQRKTMVLTGASRGIGHATVKLFSLAGWRIITCSRQPFNRDRCPWEMGPEDHVQVDLADHRSVPLAIASSRRTRSRRAPSSLCPAPRSVSMRARRSSSHSCQPFSIAALATPMPIVPAKAKARRAVLGEASGEGGVVNQGVRGRSKVNRSAGRGALATARESSTSQQWCPEPSTWSVPRAFVG